MRYKLPEELAALVDARNKLAKRYSASGLKFTFDGNLLGDLGEAVASELFDLSLVTSGNEGVDAVASNGKTVQIKATGTGRGPAFRYIANRAQHLIFLQLNLEEREVEIVFNGPEEIALSKLPRKWDGQRSLTAKQIRDADKTVKNEDRLVPAAAPISD